MLTFFFFYNNNFLPLEKKTNIFFLIFPYSVDLGYILTETQLVAFKDQKVQRSVETALITVQRRRGLVTFHRLLRPTQFCYLI